MARGRVAERFHDIQPEVLVAMIHWLEGQEGSLKDKPHLRPALASVYPTVLAVYTLLLVTAVLANLCLLLYSYRHRLYMYLSFGLGNLLLHCSVLPLTVVVLLYHDWFLGRTACYLLPLIQDMFIHFTVLSHLTLAMDAYRDVHGQPRLSSIMTSLTVWFIGLLLVIPYQPNISYTDLEALDPDLKSFGICMVSMRNHIREYIQAVVLLAYFLPVSIMMWVFVSAYRTTLRSSRRLIQEADQRPDGGVANPTTSNETCRRYREKSRYEPRYRETQQSQIHIKLLGVILLTCNACLCPLMTLKMFKTLEETFVSGGYSDLLYCAFVWLASLPAATSPALLLLREHRRSGAASFLHPRRCSDCRPGLQPPFPPVVDTDRGPTVTTISCL